MEKLFGYADCTKDDFMEVIKTGDSGTWTGNIAAKCSDAWGEKKVNAKAGDWLPGDQIKSKACSLGIYQIEYYKSIYIKNNSFCKKRYTKCSTIFSWPLL